MCLEEHLTERSLKRYGTSGVGYKLVERVGDETYTSIWSIVARKPPYLAGRTTVHLPEHCDPRCGDGFSIFTNKSRALKFKHLLDRTANGTYHHCNTPTLVKVRYLTVLDGGYPNILQSTTNPRTLLVRCFTILSEIETGRSKKCTKKTI